MKNFGVTQQISFCYGHRLVNYDGKCAHLHGHNALAELTFEAEHLDRRGMVVDFHDIKMRLKAWIDENLDHRMILHRDDPFLPLLNERGEPFFPMDANPTAENLARLLFLQAREFGLPVCEVRLWETPTQYATYRG